MKMRVAASLLTLSVIYNENVKAFVNSPTTRVGSASARFAGEKRTTFSRGTTLSYAKESDLGLGSTATTATEDIPETDIPKSTEIQRSDQGIYQLEDQEQFTSLLSAHPDKLVIIKFYAPWCRACKGLSPKFITISKGPELSSLPILFAELNVRHNKDFIKSLGVVALPSVHFYAGSDGLVENFPCGPSKVPILRRKLAEFVANKIDPVSKELLFDDGIGESEELPCKERTISTDEGGDGDVGATEDQIKFLKNEILYFKDFTDEEFDTLLSKAKMVTFESGSVIMRQGKKGKTFYVIASGEVEISIRTGMEDPLTTPSSYLGAVMNTLTANNFFGERSLITGEPRAASIRAVEKTRCFTFQVEDLPEKTVLSGKTTATSERIAQVNDKYHVDLTDLEMSEYDESIKSANMANQERGSANTPSPIQGVDPDSVLSADMRFDILPLLLRFKQVRQAARCFDYIKQTNVKFGDEGEMNRRSMLVSKLPRTQYNDFREVFRIIDTSKDGRISLMEMKLFMESANEEKSNQELLDIIQNSQPIVTDTDKVDLNNVEITMEDFMGVMAEAEFYYLFRDTFNALDKFNSGFVRAGDLDRVLCGMRDLISDDQMSIIDMDDMEMQIDYEQFSRMMIGANL